MMTTAHPIRRTLRWLQRRPGVRSALAGKHVLIYSAEHAAYWLPNRCGYTCERSAAGIYSFEEAFASTSHCGPEKRIFFEEYVEPDPISEREIQAGAYALRGKSTHFDHERKAAARAVLEAARDAARRELG